VGWGENNLHKRCPWHVWGGGGQYRWMGVSSFQFLKRLADFDETCSSMQELETCHQRESENFRGGRERR
jgi:hypothetical protein